MDDPVFAAPEIDINTQTILLHASNHDLDALKPLLRIPGNASVQDPETGYTPLHAAIAACETLVDTKGTRNENRDAKVEVEEGEEVDIEIAKGIIRELFMSGAIWNDLDANNETPGCLAWRLGHKELYELCVEAGVRAELLLGLMGGYEALESEDEDEDEEMEDEPVEGENGTKEGDKKETNGHTSNSDETQPKKDVNSEDYLKCELKFEDDKLLDSDDNGVMMAWETSIMRKTVDLLLSPLALPETTNETPTLKTGQRILNIGFGMGIIDRMFRDTKPLSHHIIEAHQSVLHHLSSTSSDFSQSWETSAPPGGKYIIHAGKWQDIAWKLIEGGEIFDVIYFDTFGEDYKELKLFFTEYVPGLMDGGGRFGWFNGLGADRRVCYDVYCRVSKLDACDAGLDVEWTDVPVEGLGGDGEGEWKGVRRRYWTLDNYRLPVCTFLG